MIDFIKVNNSFIKYLINFLKWNTIVFLLFFYQNNNCCVQSHIMRQHFVTTLYWQIWSRLDCQLQSIIVLPLVYHTFLVRMIPLLLNEQEPLLANSYIPGLCLLIHTINDWIDTCCPWQCKKWPYTSERTLPCLHLMDGPLCTQPFTMMAWLLRLSPYNILVDMPPTLYNENQVKMWFELG